MFLYVDIQLIISYYGSLAGIDAGDGFNHITIPESRTVNILNIDETSNVGIPGVWIFKIGEGTYAILLCIQYMYVRTYMQCMCVNWIEFCIVSMSLISCQNSMSMYVYNTYDLLVSANCCDLA